MQKGFPGGTSLPAKAGDLRNVSSFPELGRSPEGGYSCLENTTDRGAWWPIVHWVAESDTTEATQHAYMQKGFHSQMNLQLAWTT